jgi:decaprenylphospho-beta-D-ribofuranose 2-oxidase
MTPVQRRLTSWGRASTTISRAWPIDRPEQALECLRSAGPEGVIARGLARSYGDACLNHGGAVLDTTRLASIRSFDPVSGVLACDAGVTYRTLMRMCVPRGWQPAVCPGTAMVTMGGAVANDVHGKNHHRAGSFGEHVDWIDLLLPDGTLRRIDPASDPELFAATLGGIGLTGVILGVQQRLERIPSNAIELREVRLPDLDTFLERLGPSEWEYPHAVGWIDAVTRGRGMGRGILELGRPVPGGVREPWGASVDIPFDLPSGTLNPVTVRAFNSAYFHRVPRAGRTRLIHVSRFLFPLDAVRNWNRVYGRRGVYQFQCVVPFAEGRRAIVELMEETVRSRSASFLAVLKSMGRAGRGMLSFPMPGFTLALDFPRRARTGALIQRLQRIALKYGGRVYLAKDACLSADQLPSMYPELERFRAVLRRIDPERRMQSDMSRRLHVHEG